MPFKMPTEFMIAKSVPQLPSGEGKPTTLMGLPIPLLILAKETTVFIPQRSVARYPPFKHVLDKSWLDR